MKHWPLFGLRLTTPRLELRLPDGPELEALAEAAASGIHPPEYMPFAVPWTDAPPAEVARGVMQHYWGCLAAWSAADWRLPLTVFADGEPVGMQHLTGRDFPVVRQVESGSWLAARFQGRGYGTEMRAAVLDLAFTGLGARTAATAAHTDNARSIAVSRRLGYLPDGTTVSAVRGERVEDVRFLLTREEWAAHRTVMTEITGLEPCLGLLGLEPAAAPRAAAP